VAEFGDTVQVKPYVWVTLKLPFAPQRILFIYKALTHYRPVVAERL